MNIKFVSVSYERSSLELVRATRLLDRGGQRAQRFVAEDAVLLDRKYNATPDSLEIRSNL